MCQINYNIQIMDNSYNDEGFMLEADTLSNENQKPFVAIQDTDNYEEDGFDDEEDDSIKATAVQFQNSFSKIQQKSDSPKNSVASVQTAKPKARTILAMQPKPKPTKDDDAVNAYFAKEKK